MTDGLPRIRRDLASPFPGLLPLFRGPRKVAISQLQYGLVFGFWVSHWIRVFRWRLCVWIVPRNVASGDLSDSADSGITHLRVLNSGKGSPPPGTSLKQTSNQRFTKTQIRLCLNCAQVSPLPASQYGGLSWEFNRATAGSTHRTSLSIPL